MSDAANQRAESLAGEAKVCIEKRELQKAYQLAKEALSLAPKNSNVRSVISQLQKSDSNEQILPLCSSYLLVGNEKDGEQALQYLKQQSPIPFKDVQQLANIFFDQTGNSKKTNYHHGTTPLLDGLTAALLTSSQPIRGEFASRFSQRFAVGDPNRLFDLMYSRGEKSFNALIQTITDDSIYTSAKEFVAAKRDAFQLALGKLLEPALDNPEWLLMLASRLLAIHAEDLREQPQLKLKSLLISENFEIVLGWLDIRVSQAARSQALLATTKFLDEMKKSGKGEETVEQFVTYKVAKTHNDDLIIAFSTATACFPLCPQTISKLFLTPGFLEGLMPMLEKNELGSRKSHSLGKASMELMSAACVDKNCREAISKTCSTWLDDIANTAEEEEYASLAALVLSKIGREIASDASGVVANLDELSTTLMNMTLNSSSPAARLSSIEGLAYTSLTPKVKEEIISNNKLLKMLTGTLKTSSPTDNAAFGILTIFANLTCYRPIMTEEQKKMSQLNSYANSSKPAPEDPLDDDDRVTGRCKKALEANLIPALSSHPVRSISAIGLNQTAMILNALAREQKHRGLLAQQGAVKLLLLIIERLQGSGAAKETAYKIASHALARILISVNPTHVFSATLPASTALSPLLALLILDPEAETHNLLPAFESLLALTNLASTSDTDTLRDRIISTSFPKIEELLLSPNTLVQRAAVELICNLMASPQGVMRFADGSGDAGRRLRILLALTDAGDGKTRMAAGGALAMLTEWDRAAEAVVGMDRGVKMLVEMCEDDASGESYGEAMRHRGLVCLLNLVSVPDEGVRRRALEEIKMVDGVEVLKGALRRSRDQTVLEVGVEVLKKLIA